MKSIHCANVLQPLYAWVAGEKYSKSAHEAIADTSRAATDFLKDSSGGLEVVLDKIAYKTGVRWELTDSWDKVLINNLSLKVAYSSLTYNTDSWSNTIKFFMTNVPSDQRFGVPDKIPMKAGWDLDESSCSLLTHVVVLLKNRARVKVTNVPITNTQCELWQESLQKLGPLSVIPMHNFVAGALLQDLNSDAAEFLLNSRLL
mgnify:CR=1 FL=1